jgi:hypothetical protein
MKRITTLTLAVMAASPVLAHPGHDAALTGAAHYAFSPIHGFGVIALAAGLALVTRLVKKG